MINIVVEEIIKIIVKNKYFIIKILLYLEFNPGTV